MTTKKYIAYGSNLNREQMAKRCPQASVAGTGILKDYELVFRGTRRAAVATIEPKKGSSVPVVIWDISPFDEFRLDCYEGYPRLYGKEQIEVELEGRHEKMMAYVMTEGYSLGNPSSYYLNIICTGYQEAGFSEEDLLASVERNRERMEQEMDWDKRRCHGNNSRHFFKKSGVTFVPARSVGSPVLFKPCLRRGRP